MRVGRSQGFTLIELIVATMVATVLAATAIPSMVAFVSNNRAATQTNEIVSALVLARSEAVTRATQVSVCALQSQSGTSCVASGSSVYWDQGWMVFVDAAGAPGVLDEKDEIVRIYPALDGGNQLKGSAAALSFLDSGFLSGAEITLALRIDKCYASSNRDVAVSKTGHASVTHVVC